MAVLGLVGHMLYQICFIGGIDKTTASNSALIVGSNPVMVTLLGVLLGLERVGALHWCGTGLSMIGIYLVVGRSSSISGASLPGDLLVLGAVACWAIIPWRRVRCSHVIRRSSSRRTRWSSERSDRAGQLG